MNFTKQRQYWTDETDSYRIRESIYLDPLQYYTTFLAHGNNGEFWDTCGPSKPYRTFKAAERVTAQHALFWERMLSVQELKGKKRDARFEWVMEKRFIGRGRNCVSISGSIPSYVYDQLGDYLKDKLIPRERKKSRK